MMARSIRLEGLAGTEEIGPGGSRRIPITVTNTSDLVDQFILSVIGLDEAWFTLDPRSVSLFPSTTVRVELILHPPAGKPARAGDYPFTVLATSVSEPAASSALSSELRVTVEGKPGIDVRPLRAEGRSASFRVVLKNPSNIEVRIEPAVRDTEDGIRALIDPVGPVPVPPGEERSVQVRVRPRRRETIGGPHQYELEFLGLRPGTEDLLDPSLKRFGQYTYVPPLRTLAIPLWLRRLPIWALIALLLLLLALLFLGGRQAGNAVANAAKPAVKVSTVPTLPRITPTIAAHPNLTPSVPPPSIGDFGVKKDPKHGTSLAWSVQGAKQVTLDGTPVAPNGSMPIAAVTSHTYVLSAADAGGAVSRLLQVAPPPIKQLAVALPAKRLDVPKIRQFSVQADKHTGALTLRWQIQGGEQSFLNGQPVAAMGTRAVSRSGPRAYTLKTLNGAGGTTSTITLPAPSAAKVETASLARPGITVFTLQHPHPGTPYTLTWRTTNTQSVTLNGAAEPKTGKMILHPPLQTMRYLLTARNANGRVTGSVQVNVS